MRGVTSVVQARKIASTGVITSLEWWNTMTVDGDSFLLMNVSPDVKNETMLVIAEFGTEGGAQAMFRAIEQRIRLGAALFDARHVDPFVSRNAAHERSRCSEFPGLDPGETGILLCSKVRSVTSNRRWEFVVWFFDDSYYAEHEYGRACNAGSWLIWEDGQLWLGEVRDPSVSYSSRLPPVELVETISSDLGSSAWKDCSAVS
jgi:hypothetical protein